MFGDDFKKDLEPIKVSPELLEKTRKSIEQARVQQAQESLDRADSSSFRRRNTIRIIAVAACAVLLVGGGILLLPKLAGSKQSASRDAVMKHDAALENVMDQINKEIGDDVAYETSRASMAYAEETTTAAFDSEFEDENSEKPNQSLTFSIPSGKKYWSESLNINDKSLLISANKRSLTSIDTSDKRDLNKAADLIDLPDLKENQYISEISYSEDLKILFVKVLDENGNASYYLYDYVDDKFVFREEYKK